MNLAKPFADFVQEDPALEGEEEDLPIVQPRELATATT